MNLSTQLRAILLIVGVVLLATIYWLGRRKATARDGAMSVSSRREAYAYREFDSVDETVDEDIDERRSELYEHRVHDADYDVDKTVEMPPVYVDSRVDSEADSDSDDIADESNDDAPGQAGGAASDRLTFDSVAVTPPYAMLDESVSPVSPLIVPSEFVRTKDDAPAESQSNYSSTRRIEPTLSVDPAEMDETDEAADPFPVKLPSDTLPAAVAVRVDGDLSANVRRYVQSAEKQITQDATPVLSEVVSMPRVVKRAAAAPNAAIDHRAAGYQPAVGQTPNNQTPSNQLMAKPTNKSVSRRKIIALRLTAGVERVSGEHLLSLLQGEKLQHGKFDIFHRMHAGESVFSVASMVEPGSFDLASMTEQRFPGVTLFMLLPGTLDGLIAFEQMLSCAQHLAQALGGVVQDERGGTLLPHGIERLREEVLDFQHLLGSADVSVQ